MEYEVTVLTTPYHHHYLNVHVPPTFDGSNLMFIQDWLNKSEFAGSRIVNITPLNGFGPQY